MENKFLMRNYTEDMVDVVLAEVVNEIKVCTCEKCMMDMKAKALNDLPPRYIVTEKGELYSKINAIRQQLEVDVLTAVTKSVILVKRAPQHSISNE